MTIRNFTHRLLIALTLCVTPLVATSSLAQAPKDTSREFSEAAGEVVNIIMENMTLDDYSAALKKLDEALTLPNLTPYEKSVIYQMKGTSHYELRDTKEAIQAFEDSIAAGGLRPDEASQLRINIGQLHIVEGDYILGAEMIEQWERNGNQIKPKHIDLLVQAWVSSNNYDRALLWAEKWYDAANPKERKHFEVLNFLYNNLGMPDKQIRVIEQMTTRWPEDKSLWDALSSAYANHGRERDAFEVQRMLYLSGVLTTQADILKIVQYHSFYDMPYQAAGILDDEISRGRVAKTPERLIQLSDLYKQAREYERAAVIFENVISQGHLNETAEHLVQLSVLYKQAQNYEQADEVLKKAVEMTNEKTVENIKARLKQPKPRFHLEPSYLAKFYPEGKTPNVDRTNFKIIVSDRDALPLVRIPPIMPKQAKKSGHCRVKFNVDKRGIPQDIVATYCSEALFKDASIESVAKWKFNPKIVDGRPTKRVGVESKITFRFTDDRGKIIPE